MPRTFAPDALSPEDSLTRLREGNRRFVVGDEHRGQELDVRRFERAFERFARPCERHLDVRETGKDARAAEDVIQSSDLDWTIVRPPRLTSKPGKGTYRTAVDRNVPRCLTISRADLAAGMLALLDDAAAVHRHVCIAD